MWQGIRSSRSISATQSLKIILATGDQRSLIKTDFKKTRHSRHISMFFQHLTPIIENKSTLVKKIYISGIDVSFDFKKKNCPVIASDNV